MYRQYGLDIRNFRFCFLTFACYVYLSVNGADSETKCFYICIAITRLVHKAFPLLGENMIGIVQRGLWVRFKWTKDFTFSYSKRQTFNWNVSGPYIHSLNTSECNQYHSLSEASLHSRLKIVTVQNGCKSSLRHFGNLEESMFKHFYKWRLIIHETQSY